MKEAAGNMFYAALGAPLVAGRGIAKTGGKMVSIARNEYEAFASEGRRITDRLRSTSMVEEINSRVDLDSVQGRVDKLRDQMEDLLTNWRDSFTPESKPKTKKKAASKTPKKPEAKKSEAKKPSAEKPSASEESVEETKAAADEGAAPA